MGVSAIGAAGYQTTYRQGKTQKSVNPGAAKFMETAEKKEVQDKVAGYAEKAFDMVGQNAPQNVKDAWMEAAKEVNANGSGIRSNGMMSHISQMMVQSLNKMMRGETGDADVLGNSVASAIQATKQALYDLEHPTVYTPKNIEVQQARMKEKEFYSAFLAKLERLEEGTASNGGSANGLQAWYNGRP